MPPPHGCDTNTNRRSRRLREAQQVDAARKRARPGRARAGPPAAADRRDTACASAMLRAARPARAPRARRTTRGPRVRRTRRRRGGGGSPRCPRAGRSRSRRRSRCRAACHRRRRPRRGSRGENRDTGRATAGSVGRPAGVRAREQRVERCDRVALAAAGYRCARSGYVAAPTLLVKVPTTPTPRAPSMARKPVEPVVGDFRVGMQRRPRRARDAGRTRD